MRECVSSLHSVRKEQPAWILFYKCVINTKKQPAYILVLIWPEVCPSLIITPMRACWTSHSRFLVLNKIHSCLLFGFLLDVRAWLWGSVVRLHTRACRLRCWDLKEAPVPVHPKRHTVGLRSGLCAGHSSSSTPSGFIHRGMVMRGHTAYKDIDILFNCVLLILVGVCERTTHRCDRQ